MTAKKDTKKPRKSRAAMISQLEDLINHPNTPEKEREAAREKLAKMRERDDYSERVKEAAREKMSTPEGQWDVVKFMANSPGFAQHSVPNITLLLADAEIRGIRLTEVRKKTEWWKLGYKIKKDEHAFVQWVPKPPTQKEIKEAKAEGRTARMRFVLVAAWYDRSQMERIDRPAEKTENPNTSGAPGDAAPITRAPFALPSEPESGDRHAWLWLLKQADREGLEVLRIDDIDAPAKVTYFETEKRIGVTIPPNAEGFPDYGAVLQEFGAVLFGRVMKRNAERDRERAQPEPAEDTPEFVMNW